jgi:hypothetical protein
MIGTINSARFARRSRKRLARREQDGRMPKFRTPQGKTKGDIVNCFGQQCQKQITMSPFCFLPFLLPLRGGRPRGQRARFCCWHFFLPIIGNAFQVSPEKGAPSCYQKNLFWRISLFSFLRKGSPERKEEKGVRTLFRW